MSGLNIGFPKDSRGLPFTINDYNALQTPPFIDTGVPPFADVYRIFQQPGTVKRLLVTLAGNVYMGYDAERPTMSAEPLPAADIPATTQV